MDFVSAIRRDSDLFYATALQADPDLRVPTCPDWTIADLVWHLGGVHWFWGNDIETRATDPSEVEGAMPSRPDTYGELVAWGRSQADRMVEILQATPDDVAVWTWALDEADHTVGFIRRHQAQEAAVHRWDIQNTVAAPADPVDAAIASDAIDEILAVTLPWEVRPDRPLPGSVHLHCTDAAGEWFVHPDGRVEAIHAKGDVAIRGTASDILLALYGRVAVDGLDPVGDTALAGELIRRVDTGSSVT